MTKKPSRPSQTAPPAPPPWLQSRYFWIIPALVYAVILIFLFSGFIFSDDMLYGSDTLQAQVYMKDFHKEHFKFGDWITGDFKPKWSPYLFGGMPFVDSFNSDILNVPVYLFKFILPMDLYRALGWGLLIHFWLSGIFMYLAAHRGWGMGRMSAAIAGLAYMLAPYLISMVHPGHDGKIFVTSWFPLGFLNLKLLWDTGRLQYVGYLALVVGVIILTPHIQMAYFSLWGFGAYSAYRIIRAIALEKRMPWRATVGSLAGVLLALVMSFWQFLPGYQYVKNHSPRSGEGRGFEYASSWSLHPEEVVSSVVPDFSGVSSTTANNYWGRNFFKDNSEYGGLIALLLALYCVFRTRFRDRWFFFGLGLFAVLYGLGAHTPLFTVFYHWVPNVKQMRAPSMIMFLYLFSIALCAAAALQAFMDSKPATDRRALEPRLLWYMAFGLGGAALLLSLSPSGMMSVYTSIFYSDISPDRAAVLASHLDTLVLGFWIAALLAGATAYLSGVLQWRKAIWVFGALACLIIFDDIRMDRKFIKTISYAQYYQHDPVVDFLKSQNPGQPLRVLPVRGGFPTNYFPLKRIPELTGYHGNQLRTYNAFLGGPQQPRQFARQTLDQASVEYLIFRRGVNIGEIPADPTLELVYDRNGTVVFKNLLALPWARLVTCWERHNPDDSTYERLVAPDFDYRLCALVDEDLPFESHVDTSAVNQCRIVSYELEQVEIVVESETDALLVFTENTYPAWQATIDGEPAKVITTNATFRGVVVPAGSHSVSFQYQSDNLRTGARLYFASLLLAFGLIGFGTWRTRRSSP